MEITIDNIKEFKTYIECARAVISEDIVLRFTPEYMTIKQLDTAHVNMVEINLRDTYFAGYTVEDQRDIIVDLDSLIITIGKFEIYKSLAITFDEDTNTLKFVAVDGRKRKRGSLKTIVESETEALFIEQEVNVKFPTTLILKPKELATIAKDSVITGNEIVIVTDSASVTFVTKGSMGDNIDRFTIGEDMNALLAESGKSAYPSIVLKDITDKTTKIGEKAMVSSGTGMPLKIAYVQPKSLIQFYLAPINDENVLAVEDVL